MVIPTLAADSRLLECVESLGRQTRRDFEVIIVDNSGKGLARRNGSARGATVIENPRNAGFRRRRSIRACARPRAPFLATLNDDAVAHPGWIEALAAAIERRPDVGMCASQVRLFGEHRLDSAGMLMALDGSSKQRGHGRPPEDFPVLEEVLLPSGSAALYRRAMLDEIGGFDDDFFLYCEDTDLGLRARWAGWKCLYVPEAVVEHHYSHSAGARLSAEGLLRRTQPPVRAGQELSRARCWLAAPFVSRRGICGTRATCSKAVAAPPASAPRAMRGRAWPGTCCARTWRFSATPRRLRRQRRDIRARARITPAHFPAAGPQPFDQRQEVGSALIRADGPESLLVIVPAWNEEGAIGGVVRSIHEHVPGVPVLVIDDYSHRRDHPPRPRGRRPDPAAAASSRAGRLRPGRL